jgi:hypothetical protein
MSFNDNQLMAGNSSSTNLIKGGAANAIAKPNQATKATNNVD